MISAICKRPSRPTPEVSGSLGRLGSSARYGQYGVALVELDKLSDIPNLTDAHKKAIDEVIEQVKQAFTAASKPPQ